MQIDGPDRRKHYRMPIQGGVFVVMEQTTLGEIVNIGTDGVMAVRYLIEADNEIAAPRQIAIMMLADNFYLDKVPVTPVNDRREESIPLATTITRIAVLRLGKLSRKQKTRLASFINRHTLAVAA